MWPLLLSAAVNAAAYLAWVDAGLAVVTRTWPAVALALVAWRTPTPLARTVAVGLGLSAAGDALLELPDLFLPGLVAFLLAHLAYVVAFVRDEPRPAWPWAVPAFAWGGAVLAAIGRGALGELLVPVVVYLGVINTMIWRAAARLGRPGAAVGAAGAGSFALSDTLLALHRFGGVEVPGQDLLVMGTYWAAQAMITWAATRGR